MQYFHFVRKSVIDNGALFHIKIYVSVTCITDCLVSNNSYHEKKSSTKMTSSILVI